jgi:hypothetical protein
MTVGPYEDSPDAYEAANGMEAATPGMANDAGSRDPSSTTVAGSVTAGLAQSDWHFQNIAAQGDAPGHEISLPPAYTPNEGVGS